MDVRFDYITLGRRLAARRNRLEPLVIQGFTRVCRTARMTPAASELFSWVPVFWMYFGFAVDSRGRLY